MIDDKNQGIRPNGDSSDRDDRVSRNGNNASGMRNNNKTNSSDPVNASAYDSKRDTDLPTVQDLCTPADGVSRTKKIVFVILGSLFLLLGLVGVFIPVLPTTPFLLLTAFFYLRSSRRLYCWLIRHRLFGSYINDYMQHRAVRRKAKIAALGFLWLTLFVSMILVPILHVRIFLVVVGIAVSIHLFTLKTLK